MMKLLKKILFLTLVTLAMSFAAFAQNGDDKKGPPPKKDQPKIKVEPKEKPKENPPSNDRNNFVPPKKPKGQAGGILDAFIEF